MTLMAIAGGISLTIILLVLLAWRRRVVRRRDQTPEERYHQEVRDFKRIEHVRDTPLYTKQVGDPPSKGYGGLGP
jgi:hypothetical protein